jgi:hypothetical protein
MAWGTSAPRVVTGEPARWYGATSCGLRPGCWSEMGTTRANEQVVKGGDSSCEAETGRVRRRLAVRGEDLSCEAKTSWRSFLLLGDLSEKLPTTRKQDILPVMVLTGVLSPPYLESWPSCCQWCQNAPLSE